MSSKIGLYIIACLCVVLSPATGVLAQPVNDDCADAIAIANGRTAFDTTEATTDGPAHGGQCEVEGDGGQTFHDIWFIYNAAADGALLVTTCEELGGSADYDTDLVIYDGTNCGALTLLQCNEDDAVNPCGGGPNFHSTLNVSVTKGSSYLIRVGGWNNNHNGTGELWVMLEPTRGACCLAGGCMELSAVECADLSGTYHGDLTLCDEGDSDGDGVPDTCDGCPNDMRKIAPGDCGCGQDEVLLDVAADQEIDGTELRAMPAVSRDGRARSSRRGAPQAVERGGSLVFPAGVATDANGRVYVADADNHQVFIFASDGSQLNTIGDNAGGATPGDFNLPLGIAVDNSGCIYVADTGNARIQVFDSGGGFLFEWGSAGTADGQFDMPSGIAVDGAGRVYVADSGNDRVQVFGGAGNFLFSFGELGLGDGQFDFPRGIDVDAVGRIYVADAINNRVQVFGSAGNFLFAFGSLGANLGQFDAPHGVHVDNSGRIWVADTNNVRMQVFDSTGEFLSAFGFPLRGIDALDSPKDVAVDANGRVLVADADGGRIVGYTPSFECAGACCFSDGSCDVMGSSQCDVLGGRYQGDNTSCTVELISVSDGSFEGGTPNADWTETSTNFGTPLCDGGCITHPFFGPTDGDWYAWFGGTPIGLEDSSVQQSVTIPLAASHLSFQLRVPEVSHNGSDRMRVLIDGAEVFLLQPGTPSQERGNDTGLPLENDASPYRLGYREVIVDLIDAPGGPYNDGAEHTLRIEGRTTGAQGLTSFLVDEVKIAHTPCPVCEGDANGDFIVNVSDLLMVINNWGSNGAGGGDVNNDGIVNVSDLLMVINNWGNIC